MHFALWALIFITGGIAGPFGLYFAIESTATYSIVATNDPMNAHACASTLENLIALRGGGKLISVGAGAAADAETATHDCYAIVKHGGF